MVLILCILSDEAYIFYTKFHEISMIILKL